MTESSRRVGLPAGAFVILALGITVSAAVAAQSDAGGVPTIDQLLSVRWARSPAISPDGAWVAYVVRETNWEDDAYETEIVLASADGATSRPLTNAPGSSSAPAWSPDGSTIAFLSSRHERNQIYAIDPRGGEARALTRHDEAVSRFAWSPDGTTIAFTAMDPVPDERKARDERYGAFRVEDEDHRMRHLHLLDVATGESRRLTAGPFYVGGFAWSPDGSAIAFDHRIDGDPSSSSSGDISIVTVEDANVRRLVTQRGPDSNPVWSPDGDRIAFVSAMESPWFYYTNRRVASIPAAGGPIRSHTDAFDENPSLVAWSGDGLYFAASERTRSALYRVAPHGGADAPIERMPLDVSIIASSFDFSRDHDVVAYVASTATTHPEVFVASTSTWTPSRLSDLGVQLDGWVLGQREVIEWTSTDGTAIEGVLHKPADFVEGRRHPLLIVIHGGPTGISRPGRLGTSGVYPIDLFLARGALVLQPNYRGSAGYGEAFRSLNVRNLGVGDAWDVVSAIDHLVERGLVDVDRVGAMGWSQGGYISAFLTTAESDRFRAISVGAGISDWMTYYVNTDIHPFTRQYLKATPWEDRDIYDKTSPIHYITRANTPTLIQHGENDRRVPLPNAYELYQGLRDQGVEVKLVVFDGFGHGLNKPRAARAAMEQNLEWFTERVLDAPGPSSSAGGRDR